MPTAPNTFAAVTLPVWTLQSLRVRALATAALVALDLARREAYWASEDGRARAASMWCGEQDAVGDSLDALREFIADEQETADARAAAITASGHQPIAPDGEPGYTAGKVIGIATMLLDLQNVIGNPVNAGAWDEYAQDLRDYLAGKF